METNDDTNCDTTGDVMIILMVTYTNGFKIRMVTYNNGYKIIMVTFKNGCKIRMVT